MVRLDLYCPKCGKHGLWQDENDPGDYYAGTPTITKGHEGDYWADLTDGTRVRLTKGQAEALTADEAASVLDTLRHTNADQNRDLRERLASLLLQQAIDATNAVNYTALGHCMAAYDVLMRHARPGLLAPAIDQKET